MVAQSITLVQLARTLEAQKGTPNTCSCSLLKSSIRETWLDRRCAVCHGARKVQSWPPLVKWKGESFGAGDVVCSLSRAF